MQNAQISTKKVLLIAHKNLQRPTTVRINTIFCRSRCLRSQIEFLAARGNFITYTMMEEKFTEDLRSRSSPGGERWKGKSLDAAGSLDCTESELVDINKAPADFVVVRGQKFKVSMCIYQVYEIEREYILVYTR